MSSIRAKPCAQSFVVGKGSIYWLASEVEIISLLSLSFQTESLGKMEETLFSISLSSRAQEMYSEGIDGSRKMDGEKAQGIFILYRLNKWNMDYENLLVLAIR